MSALLSLVLPVGLAWPDCGQVDAEALRQCQEKEAVKLAQEQVSRMAAQFDRHDAAAIAALYVDDCTHRTSTGHWLKNPAEVKSYLGELLQKNPNLRNVKTVTSARFLASDLLLADGAWEFTGLETDRPAKGYFTFLYQKQGKEWRILSGRTMTPGKGS